MGGGQAEWEDKKLKDKKTYDKEHGGMMDGEDVPQIR